MRNKDLITIACRNLKAGRQMTGKIIFGIMFVLVMFLTGIGVICLFNVYKKDFNTNRLKECYYSFELDNHQCNDENLEIISSDVKEKKESLNAASSSVFYDFGIGAEPTSLEAGQLKFLIDDTSYETVNYTRTPYKSYQNILNKISLIDICMYDKNNNMFFENDGTMDVTCKVDGSLPYNAGEIMIDSYLAGVLGLNYENEDYKGANISIEYSDDEESHMLFENYRLTGIMDSDFFLKRESSFAMDFHSEHMYVNPKHEDTKQLAIIFGTLRLYYENYQDYADNYDYIDGIMSVDTSVIQDSVLNDSKERPKLTTKGIQFCMLNWMMKNIGKLLIVIILILTVLSAITVYYMYEFYSNRRANYIVMLRSIGMQKSDMRKLVIIEIMIMFLAALLMAIYFTVIILLFIRYITMMVLG